MATFAAKFLDAIDKSKTHSCKRNLSLTILEGNQIMVYSLFPKFYFSRQLNV